MRVSRGNDRKYTTLKFIWTSNLGQNILIFCDFIEPENILCKITKREKGPMQAASIATIFAKACQLWEICYFLVIYLDLVSRHFSSRMRNTYDFFSLSFSLHTGSPSRKARDQQHGEWGETESLCAGHISLLAGKFALTLWILDKS